MSEYSATISAKIIEQILGQVDNGIEQLQVKTYIPFCLGKELSNILFNSVDAMIYDPPKLTSMKQDIIGDIALLQKDTLMPKQVDKQVVKSEQPSTINVSLSSLSKKRNTLVTTHRRSISLTNRGQTLKLTERKKENLSKTLIGSTQNHLQKLKQEEIIQDPIVQKYRQKYQSQYKYQVQFKKMTLQNQKNFNQKLETLNSLKIEQTPNANLTHDYNGDLIKSTFEEDKIQCYSVRAGIDAPKKQFKDGSKVYIPPQPTPITLNRYHKQKSTNSNEWVAMDLPSFPIDRTLKTIDVKNYRRNDYKKHFGKGYSRFNQLNSTIDYTPNKDDPIDSIFSEKKHLNDSQQVCSSKLDTSTLRSSRISRRIALPKLHGRYKVLDRYQEQNCV